MTARTTDRHPARVEGKSAEHRKARHPRAKPRDSVRALDMFSGCGGSSQGIEAAGVDVWYAANHWEYAVSIHEANHPGAEHFIADLVDTAATDYYHPEQLPAADILWASPSCTNHSKSNATRAYRRNLSLFDVHDDDYEADVTHSERSRATAVCVLQYVRKHQPKIVCVENVVEFCQWGMQVGNSRKGDGSTFRWWLAELQKLGYHTRVLFLNSMFFGVPQSRDRVYIAAWQKGLREPNLDFTPAAHCGACDADVAAVQTFKKRTAAWPLAEWGKYGDQYIYTCPSCRRAVKPHATPAFAAIDWTDLGQRIGDKNLADSTMERIRRGVDKFFNSGRTSAYLVPMKAQFGIERPVDEPMVTQTTQQALAMVNSFQAVLAGNTHEREGSTCRTRSLDEPLWTQHTTQAVGVVNSPPAFLDNVQGVPRSLDNQMPTQPGSETLGFVVANRTNNVARRLDDSMPVVTTAPGGGNLLVNPPVVLTNRSTDRDAARLNAVTDPLTTVVADANHHYLISPMVHTLRGYHEGRAAAIDGIEQPLQTVSSGGNHHAMLNALFSKQNGPADATAWHQVATDPLNTLLGRDTTCMVAPSADLPRIEVEDCLYRMLKPGEIQAGMGIAPTFEMWGSARDRVKALGNAVTPPVPTWLLGQLLPSLG